MEANEESLRAAAEHQRQMIDSGDAEAFARFLHPNFTINGPNNRCAGREQVLQLFNAGALQHEQYDRTIESIAVTGDLGVVMGGETFTPSPGSPVVAMFGSKPMQRRFTDIFLFEGGEWRFLARQATITGPAPR